MKIFASDFEVMNSVIVFWWREFLHRFFIFLMITSIIQFVNLILTNSSFDLFYLLIMTIFLTIGDHYPQIRIICFTIVLFFLDISPGFILLPPILYKLSSKKV